MILQVISTLVENGIDIQHWNVYSVVSRAVKKKRMSCDASVAASALAFNAAESGKAML